MKILVLLSEQPFPPFGGSKVRNFFLWPEIAKLGPEIKVLGTSNGKLEGSYPFSTKFFPYTRDGLFLRIWNAINYSYHQWPTSEELRKAISHEIAEWNPDIIHAEELRMAAYIPKDFKKIKSCTFHNVESELLKKTGSTKIPIIGKILEKIHLYNLKKFEKNIIQSFDLKFAYSEVDKKKYEETYKVTNWQFTSGGAAIQKDSWKNQSLESSVLLAGSFSYAPNIEGAQWFFAKVFPKIKGRFHLVAAGSGATLEMRKLFSDNGVEFVDSPLDLTEIYKKCAFSIVPLLSGSGTRGRILESIGLGRVCITTTIGAEGLDLDIGEGIEICDQADEFGEAILSLLGNIEKRTAIARNGLLAIEKFSWNQVAQKLLYSWKSHS
jgi:polysaccharide biosynthesis protein PslH